MSVADYLIPRNFINLILRLRPALRSEPADVQNKLAYLVWVSPLKSRRHWYLEGYVSFTYQELDHLFGRQKFSGINERLKIFTITPNWLSDLGQTKGYKLVEDLSNGVRNYFKKTLRRMNAHRKSLVRLDGKCMHAAPKAVASKDTDGITAKAWNRGAVTSEIPIDLPRLRNYARELDRMIDTPQCDLFVGGHETDYLYRFELVSRIMSMARESEGRFYVVQRYVESKSGRLYGKDINLQTVPRSIKEVALHGLWEYDFENCHYTILYQMAARIGVKCDAIEYYLANKRAVRSAIENEIGISSDQAKTCLISLIYGARFSQRSDDAIPSEIGVDLALKLYEHPFFCLLKDDVHNASRAVIGAWERTRQRIKNEYGKWIRHSEPQSKVLSHLLQGAEAKMLETVRKLYPSEIILLQHDGFASEVQLDRLKMTEQILQSTGYKIAIEETRIQLSTDFGIGK